MKKLIVLAIILTMLVLSGTAGANPFLVCDPYTFTLTTGETGYFKVLGLPGSPITVQPYTGTGSFGFHYDLTGLASGSYTATAIACINDPTWGEVCSNASNPLPLTKPSAPTLLPTNLKLSTQ